MERLPTWVSLLGLSIVIIAAIIDQFPTKERSARENYSLATACISFIVAFFFIIANLIDKLGNMVVGNIIENAISALVVALWVIAITFIQNPKYEAATSINDQGQEVIEYANLYFFSWLNFVAAVYLFGNIIRDNLAYNPKFSQWVLLLAASVVLLSTSVALHDDICDLASETVCGRLKYAVSVGSVGLILASISILATMCGYMGKLLEVVSSVLCSVFFFFGVVVLTTADGPANSMGNMYFSVWGGTFCSFALLIGCLFPNRGESEIEEIGNPQQQHQMDDQL